MIYIYIYRILIFSYLVFSFFFVFLKIMTNTYLSKHFNFISPYDVPFSNLSYYKCLCSNASKHFKICVQTQITY